MFKKNLMMLALAGAVVLSPISALASTELVNSTTSTYDDGAEGYVTVGEDTTQSQTSSKTSIDDITTSTYENTSEAEVYATRSSTFSVIIPKVITLDGDTKQGEYQVAVKGDIAGSQKVSVTAPDTFVMSEQNASVAQKDDVTASISGAKTEWTQSEIKADTYDGTGTTVGVVSAGGITAGSWKGTFDFNILLSNENDVAVNTESTDVNN